MKYCRDCLNTKILNADRKGIYIECTKISNYCFMDYWSRTRANECKYYKSELTK